MKFTGMARSNANGQLPVRNGRNMCLKDSRGHRKLDGGMIEETFSVQNVALIALAGHR